MSINSRGTEQLVSGADNRGFTAPNSPGAVRPSVRELRDRAVLIARAAAAHIASRRVELGSDGVLASSETKSSAVDLSLIHI